MTTETPGRPAFRGPEDALRFLQQESVLGFRGGAGLSTRLLLSVLEQTPPPTRDDAFNARIEEAREVVSQHRDLKLTSFAWCFSHGTLHEFYGPPWCTATWMPLPGPNQASALRHKQYRYGDAEFLHHLPEPLQSVVLDVNR